MKNIKISKNTERLIYFLLAFAIVGGIYLAYRSFAATEQEIIFSKFPLPEQGAEFVNSTTDQTGKTKMLVKLTGQDTNNRARMEIEPNIGFQGNKQICFWYNPDAVGVETAFAIYQRGTDKAALKAKKVTNTSTGFISECFEIFLKKSVKLNFAAAVWGGSASLWKVSVKTVAPPVEDKPTTGTTSSLSIGVNDFENYGVITTKTRTGTVSGSNGQDGKKYVELYDSGESTLKVGFGGGKIKEELGVTKGQQYKACLTYANDGPGDTNYIEAYYPTTSGNVDVQKLKKTKNIQTYFTYCHEFVYNGGNGGTIYLQYPGWARNLDRTDIYKIRITGIKIQKV